MWWEGWRRQDMIALDNSLNVPGKKYDSDPKY
jgi:hypothetical protein